MFFYLVPLPEDFPVPTFVIVKEMTMRTAPMDMWRQFAYGCVADEALPTAKSTLTNTVVTTMEPKIGKYIR